MIAVADTGPLQYLVLIGAVYVLQPLYGTILVPQSVAAELQRQSTPQSVQSWILRPPSWCEVRPDPPVDPSIAFLDPGERAAIPLAQAVKADRLMIDDLEGRLEAQRRQLTVTGTVGVLAEADLGGWLDFEQSLTRLRATNFYIADAVVERVRRRLARLS